MLLVSDEQDGLEVHKDWLIRLEIEKFTLHCDAQELEDELPGRLVCTDTLQLQLDRSDKLS